MRHLIEERIRAYDENTFKSHLYAERKKLLKSVEDYFHFSTEEMASLDDLADETKPLENGFQFGDLINAIEKTVDPTIEKVKQKNHLPPEPKAVEESLLNNIAEPTQDQTTKKKSKEDIQREAEMAQELALNLPLKRISRSKMPEMTFRHHIMTQLMLSLLSHSSDYSPFSRLYFQDLAKILDISPESDLPFLESQISIQLRLVEMTSDKDKNVSQTQRNFAERFNYLKKAAEEAEAKRAESTKYSRYGKILLATLVGGAAIGITGGIAAPAIAGLIGGSFLGGYALTAYIASTHLITALFAGYGAKTTGAKMAKFLSEVEDFRTITTRCSSELSVTLAISGWISKIEDCWEQDFYNDFLVVFQRFF
eukprot:TRINITY_DN6963_c0_g1_i1.p1 TRINITY_DN6963_c0_g1~~TRINITY_DN6963_c0_g1_i1.p1  ORF type:complete len:367 (+),score=104.34 TRINITY_DN6963_c0_g1_i1:249-1349(+)